MSSERAAFAATRLRTMFKSRLAAIPREGITVIWFYTMTNPRLRFIKPLREFAYRNKLRRWGQTAYGVSRLDDAYRTEMIWFAPLADPESATVQQVKFKVAAKRQRNVTAAKWEMEGRLPAQILGIWKAEIQDCAAIDLQSFIDADDETLRGADDGCVVWVVEYCCPEQTEPGPVQQLIRSALGKSYQPWRGDGEPRRWFSDGLATSTDYLIKV